MLPKIDLQSRTKVGTGEIEFYWFENPSIGLRRTLFHRISFPLEPFDSGLEYVGQPEKTEIVIEWINLGLQDPAALDGVSIVSGITKDVEASVYLGAAHNWITLRRLELVKRDDNRYRVSGRCRIEFEQEGVAENEDFEFEADAVFVGEA